MLNSADLHDVISEVPPLEGNVLAFRRSANSWHGHTPFQGERRVVQVTWLRNTEAVEKKRKAGFLSWRLKGIFERFKKPDPVT